MPVIKERALHRWTSLVLVIVFGLAIYVPFITGIVREDKKTSKVEKRDLKQLPNLPRGYRELENYPKQFGEYYSDHFGLRETFVRIFRRLKYRLGDSPSEDVTLGKDGWMFLGSIQEDYKQYGDPLGDARNENLYTAEELDRVAVYMEGVRRFLAKQGIEYVFLIAPHKPTLYFDQLPDYVKKVNDYSAADQLYDYLRKQTDVSLVDLRPALEEEKKKHQVFLKTGTHWNQYGANVAQYEIMKAVQEMYPGTISPKLYDPSFFKMKIAKDRGLERLMGFKIKPPTLAPSFVFERGFKPIRLNRNVPSKKLFGRDTYSYENLSQDLRVVVFRDSFFTALAPYFQRHFKRSTFVWKRSNYNLLTKFIRRENPDVIIEEWVERDLPHIPKITPELVPTSGLSESRSLTSADKSSPTPLRVR